MIKEEKYKKIASAEIELDNLHKIITTTKDMA